MLYSNTLNVTVTLSLCTTSHQQYTFTVWLSVWVRERKLQKCFFYLQIIKNAKTERNFINLELSIFTSFPGLIPNSVITEQLRAFCWHRAQFAECSVKNRTFWSVLAQKLERLFKPQCTSLSMSLHFVHLMNEPTLNCNVMFSFAYILWNQIFSMMSMYQKCFWLVLLVG